MGKSDEFIGSDPQRATPGGLGGKHLQLVSNRPTEQLFRKQIPNRGVSAQRVPLIARVNVNVWWADITKCLTLIYVSDIAF